MGDSPQQPGSRGSYARFICSACRVRKIKCRLPVAHETIRPSSSPRLSVEACQRCRRLDLPCVIAPSRLRQSAAVRRHAKDPCASGNTATTPSGHSVGSVNPRFFDQYYSPSDPSGPAAAGIQSPPIARPDADEAFRAMLSSANLMSILLAQGTRFGSSISRISAPERVPVTETISNGLATLLDESLVWHRFYLPFLPTLIELRSQLIGGSFTSSSTPLLFALLALCALGQPSSELYWHQDLRRYLHSFVSYQGQTFIYDPPVHRHSVYILHVVIAYKPTALIACQQSASAAVRGSTHIMLAYSIAKSCRFGSAASSLAEFAGTESVSDDQRERKTIDVLLWCRTLNHYIQMEGSIVKPLLEMQSLLDHIDHALGIVHETILRASFSASTIHLFHVVRCGCLEMQHYLRMRKARRDIAVLASIVRDHAAICEQQKTEILRLLAESRLRRTTTQEEHSAATFLVPTESHQSRARLVTVAIFFAIMAHITPNESHDKIRPHEAARVSKLVFDVLKAPNSQGLRNFLQQFVPIKDTAVQTMLQSFTDAGQDLKLHRMSWLPPARQSSQEVLFQCWLIVDQNIARLEAELAAHVNVDGHLALIYKSAQTLEALSAPAGSSIDDAFANGSHYAASAKLVRCLHGILSTRVAQQAAATTSAQETASHTPSIELAPQTEQSMFCSTDLDFDQVFSEWTNWPYNSTWDMFQSLQESVLEGAFDH